MQNFITPTRLAIMASPQIEHNWLVKPGPLGRRLKHWLRPDIWAELETTYTGIGLAENWEALYRSIALMRKVSLEVGTFLGYTYPESLEKRVTAYLQKVKETERESK